MKKQILARIKVLEESILNKDLAEIEMMKVDSNRCFAAIRKLKNKNKRNELYVHDEDGNLGGTDSAKANIITEYFTKMLAPTNQEIKIYPPSKLEKPFTTEEISQAASKLKNGKSAECDGTQAEYIKYAPVEIHKQIAIIFNRIAETGEQLKGLNLGTLTPLQKLFINNSHWANFLHKNN